MSSSNYNFDYLKMFCGEPYTVKTNKKKKPIIINQPYVWDIITLGEKDFYGDLYTLIGNTTMYRLGLWNIGVDWNKISDFQLFCMSYQKINDSVIQMLFGDSLRLKAFELYTKYYETENEEEPEQKIILYDAEHDVEFTEDVFLEIREYIRAMFNFYPKEEFARNKATKEAIIEDDETALRISKMNPEEGSSSVLMPLISFALNHPGFKYNLEELKHLGIVQFMDSISRLQVYESTKALYSGMYSGFCDLSKPIKADPDLLNFAKDLKHKRTSNEASE